MSPMPPTRQAVATLIRAATALGQDPHGLVGLEGGQHERAGRARPTCAARPPRRGVGTPSTMACSTEETWSTRRRTGVVGRGARRDAVGDVGGGPDRFTRDDDQPRVEVGVIDDDPVEAVADLEPDPLAAVLERDPAARRVGAGVASGGRRAADARRPRIRPRNRSGLDPNVARPAVGQAPRLRDADLGVEARRRPTR